MKKNDLIIDSFLKNAEYYDCDVLDIMIERLTNRREKEIISDEKKISESILELKKRGFNDTMIENLILSKLFNKIITSDVFV